MKSAHEKQYPGDKLFRFHWRGTSMTPSEGYGRDAADAFNRLGYGGGALAALDYYEHIKPQRKKKEKAA